jgi:hypothetical protein
MTMTVAEAIKIVANDVRESYPEMSDLEACEHARDVVDPRTLDETDPESAEAYRIVLTW